MVHKYVMLVYLQFKFLTCMQNSNIILKVKFYNFIINKFKSLVNNLYLFRA